MFETGQMAIRVPPFVRFAMLLAVVLSAGCYWLVFRSHTPAQSAPHRALAPPTPVRSAPPAPSTQTLRATAPKPTRLEGQDDDRDQAAGKDHDRDKDRDHDRD